MKIQKTIVIALLSILPTLSNATWQIAQSDVTPPGEPFFHTQMPELQRISPKTHVPQSTMVVSTRTMRIAGTHHRSSHSPYKKAMLLSTHSIVNQSVDSNAFSSVFAIRINGSVKQNLERIMHRYHWKIIWKSPYDYNFDGRIVGSNLPNAVEKLLQPFPLQGVMYMSNRTMTVVPRMKL